MTNPYFNIGTFWESSGSVKGNFLLQYAQRALQFLEGAKSVKFLTEFPVSESTSEEGLTLSFLSGGTSGAAQSVEHSPASIGVAVRGLIERIGNQPVDSICCLPLWHVGGWMQLERAWATEGKVFFCDHRDLREISLRHMFAGRWLSLVPTQLQEIIQSDQGIENLKCTKGIFVGGAGMSDHLVSFIRSLNLNVYPCYGCTETAGMVSLLDSSSFLSGNDGVGTALSHARIRLNSENNQVQMQTGSLCIGRGDEKFPRDYWFESPDIGKFDRYGNLLILGRADRTIITGGEKINPAHVETILYSTGLVDQCLVYGEPDEKWGQRMVACVCPQEIDLKSLKKMVENKLEGYQQPKIWKVMDELPLSEMGKLTMEKKAEI